MTVYFHANFGLNRPRMAGLLKRALENPGMKDTELAAPFGYKAPFAARYRSWLHKTGLIEPNLPVKLTPMGDVVWENDPELATLTTQWFMHWELTTDPTRAETWHFFIHEFLPQHETFTQDDLVAGLTEKLRVHSEQHFGPGSQLNIVIVRKLIECYTQSEGLGELGIVIDKGKLLFRGTNARTLGPWDTSEQLDKSFGW